VEDGKELRRELCSIVERYGLDVVHEVMHDEFSYCDNCGCPIIRGELHMYTNIGVCYFQKESSNDGA